MNHIANIAKKLPEYGLDAMLITSPSGERYALGFHGEGLLLVTRDGARYTTDGRYIEAAREKIVGAEVSLVTAGSGHLSQAKEFIQVHGLRNVGFESGEMTVDAHRRYSQELPCILTPAQGLLDDLRASKDEGELAHMRRAQEITDEAFKAILNFIRPGLTEREIAARLVYELLRRGGEQVSFDPIVASGPNGSMPHAVPTDRKIQDGDFVTMDFGCIYQGYCSDMTRTVAVGRVTEEMEKVYNVVLQAQLAGIAAAKAGATGHDVDAAARKVIEDAGYGPYFGHSFGHSVGVEIHESPNATPANNKPLPLGAAVSAEPGIYLPGRFGVRIEDVVVLQEGGCQDITLAKKDLLIL